MWIPWRFALRILLVLVVAIIVVRATPSTAKANNTGLDPAMLKVWSWNPTLLKAIEDRSKEDVAKVRIRKSPVMMLMDSDWQDARNAPLAPQVELPNFEVIDEPPAHPAAIEPSWSQPDYYSNPNDWRRNKKNNQVRRFYRLARSGNSSGNHGFLKSFLIH